MELDDFKKPVNFSSLLIGIAGIAFAVFSYIQCRQTKGISYQLDKSASIIYDIENTSSHIQLIEDDTIHIKENVYCIRGKIWNSGNLPIPPDDIRIPFTLTLASSKRILDYKIERQYEDTSQRFTLNKIDEKTLNFDWKYFDPNNGFSFQIIYLGDENFNGKLNGKILGVSHFQDIDLVTEIPNWYYYTIIFICVLIGIFSDNIFRKLSVNQRNLTIYWKTILFAITLSILLSISYKIFNTPNIPF